MREIHRVVISGATSFLGSTLVRRLLAQNIDVFALVRASSKACARLPSHPRLHVVTCELTDTEVWVQTIGFADTFFAFAWDGHGAQGRANREIQLKNVDDTLICLKAAARLRCTRFLFAGSQAEYGKTNGLITEKTACNPILEYGKGKRMVLEQASQMAKQLDIEYVHLRIFSVYGLGDHPYALVPSCIRAFVHGEHMEMTSCTQKWNFLHVQDAAAAFVAMARCELDTQSSPIYNIASEDTRLLRDFVEEMHRLCGGNGYCDYGARKGGETPVDNWPSIERMQRVTGWKPEIPFEEGIRELIAIEQSGV